MAATTAPPSLTAVRRTVATSHYTELLARVKAEGLLERRAGFYLGRIAVITAISATLWAGVALAGLAGGAWAWAVLPLMLAHGVMAAQYAFIAHEAAHQQVFASRTTNEIVGRVLAGLLAGLSWSFWLRKHNRHHARPNTLDYDPDINIRVLSFTTESLEAKKGLEGFIARRQGWLFPILLTLTGFDLLLDSMVSLSRRDGRPLGQRISEFAFIITRHAVPAAVLVALFGPWAGAGLWLAFMLSFGLFMGGAFAPNHKGMPLVAPDAVIDFFSRQVLTSRNVRPSWWTDNLMGGLNYQVEHHLFPSMPRPHLLRARAIVRDYCARLSIPYTEMGLWSSYRAAMDWLNKVGLSGNTDPFVCPMVASLRPRT